MTINIKHILSGLVSTSWHIGFVNGGIDSVINDDKLDVTWVKDPMRKKRWFADPFILDVTNDYVFLLVEEVRKIAPKGRITKLTINRHSSIIEKAEPIIETDYHMSFPNILRIGEEVYIYPENAKEGTLPIYRYDSNSNTAQFLNTICDDSIWDSCITTLFGEPLLFTANHNDYYLDIYRWNASEGRFIPYKSIVSDEKNSRMAGQLFEYKGEIYAPFQNCSRTYGGNIDLKTIRFSNGDFSFSVVKRLFSPHPKYKESLHTLNEYKGIAVIDVRGYDYFIGKVMVGLKQYLRRTLRRNLP